MTVCTCIQTPTYYYFSGPGFSVVFISLLLLPGPSREAAALQCLWGPLPREKVSRWLHAWSTIRQRYTKQQQPAQPAQSAAQEAPQPEAAGQAAAACAPGHQHRREHEHICTGGTHRQHNELDVSKQQHGAGRGGGGAASSRQQEAVAPGSLLGL